eukprot:9111110-Alexandrium_andersonii.AAC.1
MKRLFGGTEVRTRNSTHRGEAGASGQRPTRSSAPQSLVKTGLSRAPVASRIGGLRIGACEFAMSRLR